MGDLNFPYNDVGPDLSCLLFGVQQRGASNPGYQGSTSNPEYQGITSHPAYPGGTESTEYPGGLEIPAYPGGSSNPTFVDALDYDLASEDNMPNEYAAPSYEQRQLIQQQFHQQQQALQQAQQQPSYQPDPARLQYLAEQTQARTSRSQSQQQGWGGHVQSPQNVLPSDPPTQAKVPISRVAAKTSYAAAGGPISRDVVIPPRAKPGRKAMADEDASDRRRAQNRHAQRNFRDKRQQKMSELQAQLHSDQEQYKADSNKYERTIAAERKKNQELTERFAIVKERNEHHIQRLVTRIHELEAEVAGHQARQGNAAGNDGRFDSISAAVQQHAQQMASFRSARTMGPQGGIANITPTEEDFGEQDFTNVWARKSAKQKPSTDRTQSTYSIEDIDAEAGTCGFCTDPGNCTCRLAPRTTTETNVETAGNCDACQRDPVRQAACRSLAGEAQDPPPNTLAPMMSCSDYLTLARAKQPLASLSELMRFRPTTYASSSGALQVNEQEAAQALSALANQATNAQR